MASGAPPYLLLLFLHVLLIFTKTSFAQSNNKINDDDDHVDEPQLLMQFKKSLVNATKLDDWDPKVLPLCVGKQSKWNGLVCNKKSQLTGLRLENMGLSGRIDVDTLAKLPILYSLSVINNSFSGPFPEVKKIGKLRSLYLSNNQFNGEIPDDAFSGMKRMRRVILANNEFVGGIPKSILGLPYLVELQLEDNEFGGGIPDFWQKDLIVNFANNKLEGPIPASLSSQNVTSFLGNKLCGKPLEPCKSKKSKTPKLAFIVAAIIGGVIAAIVIISIIFCRRRPKPLKYKKSVKMKEPAQMGGATHNKRSEQGKLYFIRNDRERFDLEDLLRASAELLGSGSFGSSYKAVLFRGQTYVVRRFRQMSNFGREEFYEHMRRLGKLSHPNLLPLVAFYYRRDEKLLVTDFVKNNSLASHLHGKRNPNRAFDWPTRLKIIKGVARGLAYIHKELPTLTLPHGHLKSSNVLLNGSYEPILADYALAPVINKEHAQQYMVAYKSPEFTKYDRVSKKTDVWSIGILILELLTGRFPANYLKQGRADTADLATWVNSVVREEWTGEVFDKDMNTARNCEGQMLRLLKIGMCCCEWNVERRWDLREAVERIEELKERDSDDNYSLYASGDDIYSSKAVTDDDFSFSVAG